MVRGHHLNPSFVLVAVHGLSSLFGALSVVEHSLFRCHPPPPPPVLVPNKHPCLCGRQAIIYGHGGQATENAGGSWYRCLKVEEEANPPFSVSVLCVCLSLSVSVSLMTIYTLGNFELFFSFQACKLFHSKR